MTRPLLQLQLPHASAMLQASGSGTARPQAVVLSCKEHTHTNTTHIGKQLWMHHAFNISHKDCNCSQLFNKMRSVHMCFSNMKL